MHIAKLPDVIFENQTTIMKNFHFAVCLFLFTVIKAQIPNAGFETWSIVESDTMPDNWYISAFGAAQTDDAYSGDHAVVVWNWYYYALGMAYLSDGPGALSVSQGFISDYGVASDLRPVTLKGYYKYIYGNNGGEADSAIVSISLRKYDADLHIKDSIGYGELHLPPVDTYTPFSVTVNYYNELIPDTMVIALYSSAYGSMCDVTSDGNCLYFYVDELTLQTAADNIPVDEIINGNAYPVPSEDLLHIPVTNAQHCNLQLFDAAGKILQPSCTISGNEMILDVTQLPKGIYFYMLSDDPGQYYKGSFVH